MPWGFTGLVVVVPAVGRFFEREESEEGIGIVGILIYQGGCFKGQEQL